MANDPAKGRTTYRTGHSAGLGIGTGSTGDPGQSQSKRRKLD